MISDTMGNTAELPSIKLVCSWPKVPPTIATAQDCIAGGGTFGGKLPSDPPPPDNAPAPPPTTVAYAPPAPPSAQDITRVKLGGSGGVFRVVDVVNDSHRINFILDSGSADVSISPTLFKLLMDNGTLQESDIIDVMKYRTANGGVMEGLRFRIRSIQVGDKIAYSVLGSASLGTQNSGMLLGMSFLRKFKGWAIDNATNELLLK